MISVCVATYNSERYIKNTLKSIQNQTYTNFEVIIVDDHSTDNTVNIILEFCLNDNRFKLFTNCTPDDDPYVQAHNLSYKYAQGEYLVRIDNDDIYESDYLECLVNYMTNDNLDFCCLSQDHYTYDENDNVIQNQDIICDIVYKDTIDEFNNDPAAYYYKACYHSDRYQHWHNNTSCIRKTYYDTYNFEFLPHIIDDGNFWVQVFMRGGKCKKYSDIKVHKIYTAKNISLGVDLPISDEINCYLLQLCYDYFTSYDNITDDISYIISCIKFKLDYFKEKIKNTNMQNDNELEYYHFVTEEIDVYFPKDPADAEKYIVCTCARGENDYIIEYVDHYLNFGFDKIIICDNNPDESLSEILKDYVNNGTVEIFPCHNFNSFQVQFYSMFCHEGNYKWCAYFDADEFLEIPLYNNIKEFLDTVEEDCISFNWIVYGTGGQYHKTEGTVQERFTEPVRPLIMFKENVFVKSILRGGYDRFKDVWFNGSHIPACSNPVTYNIGGYHKVDYQSHTHFPPRYKIGYIKHYYTKSFDEWIKKASRGWPDGTPTLNTANVFLCDNVSHFPIEKYVEAFFIESQNNYNLPETWKDLVDAYDVIQFTNSDKQVYAFMSQVISLMRGVKDHTFVFADEHIDDAMFCIFLEYAMETGNRAVFARNHTEVWNAYLKYSDKRSETYYILDLK